MPGPVNGCGTFCSLPEARSGYIPRMKHHVRVLGSAVASVATLGMAAMSPLFAEDEPKKTRDEMVRDDRDALSDSAHWIYNDLGKAFAEAQRSGMPLMVVHRCIP